MRFENKLRRDAKQAKARVLKNSKPYFDAVVSLQFGSRNINKSRRFTTILTCFSCLLVLLFAGQIVLSASVPQKTLAYPTYNTRYTEIEKENKSDDNGIVQEIPKKYAELLPDLNYTPVIGTGNAKLELDSNFLGKLNDVSITKGNVINSDNNRTLYFLWSVTSPATQPLITIDIYTVYDNSCAIKRGYFAYSLDKVANTFKYTIDVNGVTVYYTQAESQDDNHIVGVYQHDGIYIVVVYSAPTMPTPEQLRDIIIQITYS